MLNENIIKEFQRLIALKKSEKEEFVKKKDNKNTIFTWSLVLRLRFLNENILLE